MAEETVIFAQGDCCKLSRCESAINFYTIFNVTTWFSSSNSAESTFYNLNFYCFPRLFVYLQSSIKFNF